MNELQKHLLNMMAWLHDFIVGHGLVYYVCDGTMLGAARHNGFIPWDDDIDIMMPRDDYEQLCLLLSEETDGYVIETVHSQSKTFLYTLAKFYDTRTTMTEVLRNNITRGVYIDIFPLDGLGNDKEEACKTLKKINRKNYFLMTRVCAYRKDRAWYKNIAIFLSRMIPNFLVNEKKIAVKIDSLNKEKKYFDYDYVGMTMSTYGERDIHSKLTLGEPTEYKFEDIIVFGPEKFEEYLTEIYGNWRKMPPEEKRHSAHDFINLDLNKPYTKEYNYNKRINIC